MLIWIVTVLLVLAAGIGWLVLRSDTERYIHGAGSPINFFFKWGRVYHHFFKVAIIITIIFAIFSLYKFLLSAPDFFALAVGLLAGFVMAAGKELLDKGITRDDILASLLGLSIGAFGLVFLFFR